MVRVNDNDNDDNECECVCELCEARSEWTLNWNDINIFCEDKSAYFLLVFLLFENKISRWYSFYLPIYEFAGAQPKLRQR